MSAHPGNLTLIRSLQASWRDPDPESFVSLFTPNGEFEDVPYGIHVQGHAQLRAHALRVKKHNVQLHVEVTRCDATENTAVAEWRMSHVYAGNFDGVDCSGKWIELRGLSIYEFADNRIARATDYWNYMEMIRAVGVLPRELRGLRTS
jgi:steroid delta-isomerase-like uncharacterized protein